MMHIAPSYRAFAGGMVAGMIGVAVFAGAKASADPVPPAPQPAGGERVRAVDSRRRTGGSRSRGRHARAGSALPDTRRHRDAA
jgi:hypothetical protein